MRKVEWKTENGNRVVTWNGLSVSDGGTNVSREQMLAELERMIIESEEE